MKFYQNKNAPSWIILSIDLAITVFSLLSAYFLRFNFSIPEEEYLRFSYVFTYVLFFRMLFFVVFRSQRSIIRHTNLKDLQKLYLSITSGTVVMGTLNLIIHYLFGYDFVVPFSVLLIEYVLTYFFAASFRAAIRLIFQEFNTSGKNRSKVVIIGAGESGVTTKNALDRSKDNNYEIVAFVDNDPGKVGKTLEDVKIIHEDRLEDLLKSEKPERMIISLSQIDDEKRRDLIETGLEHNIEVQNIPPVERWINGELSTRQIKNVRIEDLLGRKQIVLEQDKISHQLKDKIVLVTGAAGSIGSGLVQQIAPFFPEKIIMLDQAETPLYELELRMIDQYGRTSIEPVIGDITDAVRMRRLFELFKPQVVYHAAAYKHVPVMEENPSESIRTNVGGTKILVDLSDEFGVEDFVMISTDKAVNPTNVMGSSKRIAEIYAQVKNAKSKTRYITTRFGNVLGSSGSVVPLFRKQIEDGGPVTVTHPEITRYFMTIQEACQLVLEAGMMGEGGEIFVFDMGQSVKILQLAEKMIKLSGMEPERDIKIKFTGLRPGEKLYEELLANDENTTKTHHPQIMIAKVREYGADSVMRLIDQLLESYASQNNFEIVRRMKTIVPEFNSKNSIYSKLDQELS
ncbi:MAG TPA: polysaccharide biosynthesis protein [Flavobacteriales bacterium]|jgi:FlaA1/EpsC-like NDP-sugar epimerase|nr:polysaccharide biosynthesis protein [Flavobacteriales bacterium]